MLHPLRVMGLSALLLAVVALPGAASAIAPAAPPASPSEEPLPASDRFALIEAPRVVEPDERLAARTISADAVSPPPSVFEDAQVVSFYGYPGIGFMGALGLYSPAQALEQVARVAAEYEALGGREAQPALHLIVAVAQARPQPDGSYLARMDEAVIADYVEAARAAGALLFLDVQIGWSDPLAEVQRLEWALREPFVHLALDPEFATRARGLAPGTVIGSLDAADVNAVQRYLAGLVEARRLPPKVLVLHQFLADMLGRPELYEDVPEVELVVDMDGFGGQSVKLNHYDAYALAPYSERPAIKLFYHWDEPLFSPAQLQALERPPDLVIYQ